MTNFGSASHDLPVPTVLRRSCAGPWRWLGREVYVSQQCRRPPRSEVAKLQAETGHVPIPSLRVLLVDDNPDTVTTLALLAKESGYDVRTAHDGSAGVETAGEYRPNVVLLEIGLPGINGFEVAKRLREQPALRDAVLVAITGYGAPSDRQRSLGAGFDHHLIKPGDCRKGPADPGEGLRDDVLFYSEKTGRN